MKILLIVNTDGALYVFRRPIIKALIKIGHEVCSISGKSQYFDRLKTDGVKSIELDFARHSTGLLKNFALIFQLCRLIQNVRPEIVHNFTHKPAVFGTWAAYVVGVKRIFITITGLGTLFINVDVKSKLTRELLILQYRLAVPFATAVFFQNPDDFNYFVQRGVVSRSKAIMTNGSGIDLEEFGRTSSPQRNKFRQMLSMELDDELLERTVVLFPARGVREKGFFEYYYAARMLNDRYPRRFVFLHLGLVDKDAVGHVSSDGIQSFAQRCGVKYLGFKDNIRDYMVASDIVTLPSYREGVPRSLIEALALGRTIVTSDAPGCRETVIDGWNGYLCEPGSAESLAHQLEKVTQDFCAQSFERSRRLCEEKFDARMLVQLTLEAYQLKI